MKKMMMSMAIVLGLMGAGCAHMYKGHCGECAKKEKCAECEKKADCKGECDKDAKKDEAKK